MEKKAVIERILELGTFIAFAALVIVVLVQVATRFLIPSIIVAWTEETTRLLFVFSVVFAAPLAMKKKEYVNVDLLLNIVPEGVKKIAELLIQVATVGLFALVFTKGIEFAKLGIGQTSSTLGIPMYYVYSSIPIMSFFIMLYAIYHLIGNIRGMKDRGDIT